MWVTPDRSESCLREAVTQRRCAPRPRSCRLTGAWDPKGAVRPGGRGAGDGGWGRMPHWGAWSWQAVVPVPSTAASSEEENSNHRRLRSLGDGPESWPHHVPAVWPPVLSNRGPDFSGPHVTTCSSPLRTAAVSRAPCHLRELLCTRPSFRTGRLRRRTEVARPRAQGP